MWDPLDCSITYQCPNLNVGWIYFCSQKRLWDFIHHLKTWKPLRTCKFISMVYCVFWVNKDWSFVCFMIYFGEMIGFALINLLHITKCTAEAWIGHRKLWKIEMTDSSSRWFMRCIVYKHLPYWTHSQGTCVCIFVTRRGNIQEFRLELSCMKNI